MLFSTKENTTYQFHQFITDIRRHKNNYLALAHNVNFLSVSFFHLNSKHFFELKTEQIKHQF